MPAPKCPTCRTPHPRANARPGTLLTCESCQEEFKAPLREDDDEPAPAVARPKRRDDEPAAKRAKRRDDEPADKPAPKRAKRRDDDDDKPRRRRAAPAAEGSSTLLTGGAVGAVALLILVGVVVWAASGRGAKDQDARADADTADGARRVSAPPPPVPAPPSQDERTREQQRQNPPDVLPPNPAAPTGTPPGTPPNPPEPPTPKFIDPVPPPAPPKPVAPPPPPLPKFEEPANPYKAGTQTRLREQRAVKLPALPAPAKNDNQPWLRSTNEYVKFAYAPKQELLFALSPKKVWVYDVKAGKEVGTHEAKETFTDLSLSPDGTALFVADYGGEQIGYGTPIKPSRVQRFDLKARTWEERKAPKIAFRIEAVDGSRVLLLERDQWVAVTLNLWEPDGVGVRELARIGSDYYGDIEYDPRTGRILHGSTGSSSQQVTVNRIDGNGLKAEANTGTYGSGQGGGPTVVLSPDGGRLYYGALQFDTKDLKAKPTKMQGVVVAASRDVAFTDAAYYRATTGSKLGEFDFKTTAVEPKWGDKIGPVITVSPDGLSVWVLDREKNQVRQFALEGDKE